MEQEHDVVVIGGGAAGLSGAVALSRARRSVLVVDSGQPRNAPAGHLHNLLGQDGTTPAELLARGRAEVASYGGRIAQGTVVAAERAGAGFRVTLADGGTLRARRLLVTTGLVDELPDVPGLAGQWGSGVLHCPYCHGWEVRDRRVGVLATSPLAVHQVLMWRQWTRDLTLLLHTTGEPSAEVAEQLEARGIAVVRGQVVAVEADAHGLTGVRLAGGEVVPLAALVVGAPVAARADVLVSLGLETSVLEMGGVVIGTYLAVDPVGATAVPGVWAAGNVADPRAQVVSAAAAGLMAAAAINADLTEEETRWAVAAHRAAAIPPVFDQAFWDARYAGADRLFSGEVNPQLVAEVAELSPGTAVDVGSGEGADAVWLALRGWDVTAVDVSSVALGRAAGVAAAILGEDAARISWLQADVLTWGPEPGSADLVSAQFMHLAGPHRRALYARLAAGVAPGGTLLIVGHDRSDVGSGAHRWDVPDMFFTAEELVAGLDPRRWDMQVAESRPRTAAGEGGAPVTVHDVVLRARRRD